MKYALATNPPIVLQDGCDYDLNDGKRYSVVEIKDLTANQRKALGVLTIAALPTPKPSEDVISEDVILKNGDAVIDRKVKPIAVEKRKQRMFAALADQRWLVENNGVMFGMSRLPTDDRSKMLIFAARSKAKEDDTYTTKWKVAPGTFVTFDAPTLLALGDVVEAHVSACFAYEDKLSVQITQCATHAALDAIDINSGWPE